MSEATISPALLDNYFKNLINRFFKILPMKECEEATLSVYISSLEFEMLGFSGLTEAIEYDSEYVSLLSILERLRDGSDCSLSDVRREIFRAISIIEKLRGRYALGSEAAK